MKKCNFVRSSKNENDALKSYVVIRKVKPGLRINIDSLAERGDKLIPKTEEWRLDQSYPIHNDIDNAINYAKLKLNQLNYRPGDAFILEFNEASAKVKASFLSGSPTQYLCQITDICKYLTEYQFKPDEKLEIKLEHPTKNCSL